MAANQLLTLCLSFDRRVESKKLEIQCKLQRSVLSSSLDAWHLATSKHSIFLPTSKAMSKEVHPSSRLQGSTLVILPLIPSSLPQQRHMSYVSHIIISIQKRSLCPGLSNETSGFKALAIRQLMSGCSEDPNSLDRQPSVIAHDTHISRENQLQLLSTGQKKFK